MTRRADEALGESDTLDAPMIRTPHIDAHHHIWDLRQHRYTWLEAEVPATRAWIGDYAAIRRTFPISEYLDEALPAGLVGSVHVEAGWDGDPVGETTWLAEVARETGFPTAIIAAADLRRPDVARTLDRQCTCPLVRGIRMTEMGSLVADSAFRRGFRELAPRNLSYDLNLRWPSAPLALDLARTFPDTTIVVGNTGNPSSLDAAEFEAWRRAMSALAAAPNVAMKVSGLGMAGHDASPVAIRPWVLAAIETFGVERTMFATNWPVDRLYGTYADLIAAYLEIVHGSSPYERDALFRRNAERYYRL